MAQPTPPDDDKYFDLLCHVCKRGRVEQLKTLLTQYNVRKHYSKRDDSGLAPIHYAASAGQIECIKLLLGKDSDLINVRTKKDGMTALHLAAKKGQEATVTALLDSGSEVDVRDKEKNQTPLHLACYYGHEAVVKVLLARGAAVASKMSSGETPLERATLKGHLGIVAILAELLPRTSQRRLVTPVTPVRTAPLLVSLAPDPVAWLRAGFATLVSAFYIIEADFEFFETDGDGCISLSELVTGFQQMPGNIPHKFVIALFTEVDKEGKGYIGEADFASLMFLWIRNRQVNQKLVEHHNAEEAKILTDALALLDRLFAQFAEPNATHLKKERVRDLLFAIEDAPAKARLEAEMHALDLGPLLPAPSLPGLLYSCGLPEELFLQLTWSNCPGVPKFAESHHRFMSTISFPGLQSVVMERLNLKSTRVFALNFCPASGPTVLLDSEDALSVAIAAILNTPEKNLHVLVVEPGTGAKAPSPSMEATRRKRSKERLFTTPIKSPKATHSVARLEITVQQLARKDRQKYEWEVPYSEIQFLSRIGAGGYGEVWLANWRNRQVAAKTIKPASGDNPQLLASFLHEIGLLTQLKHPNIVQFEAACLQLETICYLTEYMPNGSLFTFLRRGPIDPPVRLKLALTGARGMQFLHSCTPPLIHRDLKSHNLLVDNEFQLKVCDFGISKILEHDETTNTKLGTLSWMAPEALLDSKYTKESDVYSYGMVLWEIVSGQQPFQELQAPIKIMGRIIEGDRPAMPPHTDPGYAAIVRRCWDWQPHARPSFDFVVKELEKLPGALVKP